MWTIGVFVEFPQSGKWVETLFREEGERAYSILRYVNGEAGRLRARRVERALTWREAARWAGRLSTMRIGAWEHTRVTVRGVGRLQGQVIGLAMEDPRWSRRGAMGRVLRGLADDQIARLGEICGGFRNRGAMEGLGKLLETVWELGMRPTEVEALYRFADVSWDLSFADLAREVEGRMVGKVLDGLGRRRRVGALDVLDRYRPELSLEERVRVARAFVKGEGRPRDGVRFVEWVLGDVAGEVLGRLGKGERRAFREWFVGAERGRERAAWGRLAGVVG
jgi:hypothetical protein